MIYWQAGAKYSWYLFSEFYTRSIMTTKEICDIIRYIKRKAECGRYSRKRKRKEKDMAAMGRKYSLYSYLYESSLDQQLERGFDLVRSYRHKHLRENVAFSGICRE